MGPHHYYPEGVVVETRLLSFFLPKRPQQGGATWHYECAGHQRGLLTVQYAPRRRTTNNNNRYELREN